MREVADVKSRDAGDRLKQGRASRELYAATRRVHTLWAQFRSPHRMVAFCSRSRPTCRAKAASHLSIR